MITRSAVLLIAFNRFDSFKEVFWSVKNAGVPRLYVAIDGPRKDNESDASAFKQIKSFIENGVDWDCSLKYLVRKNNLGCKYGVASAIDWFFQNEEEGIILEDDCNPDPSFFEFADQLLGKFRNDSRVMMISGHNRFPFLNKSYKCSYFYSRLGSVWGWASWRRAWQKNDLELSSYITYEKDKVLELLFSDVNVRENRRKILEQCLQGLDTWDYQWSFSRLINSGLSIVPSVNLIDNIGIGHPLATHTKTKVCLPPSEPVVFPIQHNDIIVPDCVFDNALFNLSIRKKTIFREIKKYVKSFLN